MGAERRPGQELRQKGKHRKRPKHWHRGLGEARRWVAADANLTLELRRLRVRPMGGRDDQQQL